MLQEVMVSGLLCIVIVVGGILKFIQDGIIGMLIVFDDDVLLVLVLWYVSVEKKVSKKIGFVVW